MGTQATGFSHSHHAFSINTSNNTYIHTGSHGSESRADPLPHLHLREVHHQDSLNRGQHGVCSEVSEGNYEVYSTVQADRLCRDENDLPKVLCGQQGPLQVQEGRHLHCQKQGPQAKAYCKRNKPNDRYPAVSDGHMKMWYTAKGGKRYPKKGFSCTTVCSKPL